MRSCWLVPDDYGGGVISVAQACCREAAAQGHDATLLTLLPPSGHAEEFGGVRVQSLGASPTDPASPLRFVTWLRDNPQDVVFLNGCEQVDDTPPFIPAATRAIYVVHDTAARYFEAALRHEHALDAIVAVSETVAARLRHRLKQPEKLFVIHNGTVFPLLYKAVRRSGDLVFLGGDKHIKGAADVLALWPHLLEQGFAGRLHWFGSVGNVMHRRIAALPDAGRIALHGKVARGRIFEIAGLSGTLLMLSRVEPFGMATVECMGMGCAVLSWDIDTGTKEIVRAPEEGRFVTLGDYAALAAAALATLRIGEPQRHALAQRVRGKFSAGAMWERYEVMLKQVMAGALAQRADPAQTPPAYSPPRRLFQILPERVRAPIREMVGRSARLGYILRDFRGR
ncbi:MAG: glycosyltransferase family 4 protein [Alteraurantiacibacter sp.]